MAGWHWMTKTGFRQGCAAGLMFCDRKTVRRDFNTGKPTTFWADRRDCASDEELKAAIQSALGRGGAVTAGAGSSFVLEATANAPDRATEGAGRRPGFGRTHTVAGGHCGGFGSAGRLAKNRAPFAQFASSISPSSNSIYLLTILRPSPVPRIWPTLLAR